MSDGPGEWVPKNAFVMPELPTSLKIEPVVAALLHVAAFLELSTDAAVNPDYAVEAMEHIGHYLQQLPEDRVVALKEQLGRVTAHARKEKWGDDAVDFFGDFMENFGLGAEGSDDD